MATNNFFDNNKEWLILIVVTAICVTIILLSW